MNPPQLVNYSSSEDETTTNRIPSSSSTQQSSSEPSTAPQYDLATLQSWNEWWAQPMPELELDATTLTAPPLKGGFTSEQEAHSYCQNWAAENSYALSIRNSVSKAKRGGRFAVYLICDRGREYRQTAIAEENRLRNSSTIKTDCPFAINIKKNNKSE
jgi:hypothetical protein